MKNSTSAPLLPNGLLSAALSVKEGNKLIAEFMGVEFNADKTKCKHPLIAAPWPPIECLKYNSSWDWLMPVVEKINKLNKMVSINLWSENNATECKIYNWELGAPCQETECEEPIKAVWSCVVEFIQWYNVNTAAVGIR